MLADDMNISRGSKAPIPPLVQTLQFKFIHGSKPLVYLLKEK
jgi:hypothetical protein